MTSTKMRTIESGGQFQGEKNSSKCTYLLPKLKSYSQNEYSTYANISLKKQPYSHYPTTLANHDRQGVSIETNSKTQLSKLSMNILKYQYINKSPNYFKKQLKMIQQSKLDEVSYHQPVELYLQEKKKDFDKKALIDLVNNRIKSVSTTNKQNSTITYRQQNSKDSTGIQHKFSNSQFHPQNFITRNLSQKSSHAQIVEKKNQSIKSQIKAQNTLVQDIKRSRKSVDLSHVQSLKQRLIEQKSNFRTIQKSNVEFYQTKYSQFQPNKLENVKNHIKSIKKHPSLKLNPYAFH